jgi:tRNA(Glu) U13 pseudouridine synthase TruD
VLLLLLQEDLMREVLLSDGLSVEQVSAKVMNITLVAQDRPLLRRPTDVVWRWLSDSGSNDDDDHHHHHHHHHHQRHSGSRVVVGNGLLGGGGGGGGGGGSATLELQFSLPPGTYATCALRELSRRPISWQQHTY